ncbi:ribonuclease HII [Radiobacillus sp. PE A8.2]|uniref:ribonuclease HII n=1 Tax=Radiobacillus sp. PE A8.2 TaxID=3380349 RepID=UPI00388DCD65
MGDKFSITEIKQLLLDEEVSVVQLDQLKQDVRIGVQRLLKQYEKKVAKQQQLEQLYHKMLHFERVQYQLGKKMIAGVDEVGRGPLAGPVVAAAVILPDDFYLPGINDSKQLSQQQRDKYFDVISSEAISFGIGMVHNQEIDEINIYQATKLAMKKAINQLTLTPEHVLIDAMQLEDLPCSSESVIKGDQKSVSIAAASIVAKVTRDRFMENIDHKYPMYKFSSNMGYGTKDHIHAIDRYGTCPYHRTSFAPIKQVLTNA